MKKSILYVRFCFVYFSSCNSYLYCRLAKVLKVTRSLAYGDDGEQLGVVTSDQHGYFHSYEKIVQGVLVPCLINLQLIRLL